MDSIKLCTCNNCGNIYEDLNPSEESVNYSSGLIPLFQISELPTIKHEDGYIGYGCPACKTDGNLQDNVNGLAGGMAEELHVYLYE